MQYLAWHDSHRGNEGDRSVHTCPWPTLKAFALKATQHDKTRHLDTSGTEDVILHSYKVMCTLSYLMNAYLVRVGQSVALPEGQLELEPALIDLNDGSLHQLVFLHD